MSMNVLQIDRETDILMSTCINVHTNTHRHTQMLDDKVIIVVLIAPNIHLFCDCMCSCR